MRKSLLNTYHELKESGANASTDFPLLLGNVLYKVLLDKFKGVSSPWRQYVMISDLADFKSNDRIILGESPDLLEVEEGGPYSDSTIAENRYQIQAKTYGRTFTVTRKTIINDDLQGMKMLPAKFGRAAARTLIKKIVDILEGDHNAYDGSSLFRHTSGSANIIGTALANTAAGAAAVASLMAIIRKATEPNSGEKMGLEPRFLMVPPDLEDAAMRLINSQQLLPTSTNGGGTRNQNITRLSLLVEPFLTSATKWYVLSGAEDAPFCEVGFLNGKDTPDLLVKKAEAVSIAGGSEDPYGYEFDDISYKVRHDWAISAAFYQGITRGGS